MTEFIPNAGGGAPQTFIDGEKYLYDPRGNLLIVLDASGYIKERDLTGLGLSQILATETDIEISGAIPGTVEWMLTNQVGSVVDVLDHSGNVFDHVRYDSFGNVEAQTNGADAMRFGYAGMQTDAETGLNYDNARYYDPQSGRFVSQDPLSFGGGDYNLYRYAANMSPFASDPSGLAFTTTLEGSYNPDDYGSGVATDLSSSTGGYSGPNAVNVGNDIPELSKIEIRKRKEAAEPIIQSSGGYDYNEYSTRPGIGCEQKDEGPREDDTYPGGPIYIHTLTVIQSDEHGQHWIHTWKKVGTSNSDEAIHDYKESIKQFVDAMQQIAAAGEQVSDFA